MNKTNKTKKINIYLKNILHIKNICNLYKYLKIIFIDLLFQIIYVTLWMKMNKQIISLQKIYIN